jgi:hypothetical protein
MHLSGQYDRRFLCRGMSLKAKLERQFHNICIGGYDYLPISLLARYVPGILCSSCLAPPVGSPATRSFSSTFLLAALSWPVHVVPILLSSLR